MRSRMRAQLKIIDKVVGHQDRVFYTPNRDKQGNLILKFRTKESVKLPLFDFRSYQLEVQRELFVGSYKRFYLWRPRRAGKEVESWNMIIQGALTEPGLYLMIYPNNIRGRDVLWNGAITMPDGTSFPFLDMLPRQFIRRKVEDEMTIHLTNGSVIKVLGSDIDPNKLRGTNARGVVFSEFAFSDPRVRLTLMPSLRQNKGWIIIQTTPNGMNHAYMLMKELQNNPEWYCRIDTVETLVDENGERYVTDEMVDADRKGGMPEWMVRQEYYCDVEVNTEILYFSKEINYLQQNEKILSGIILSDTPVYAAMDIGINDTCAVNIFQLDRNGKPVIIYYFEKNNQTFEYYINQIYSFCAKHNLYFRSIYVPHDGQKRDFNTGKNTVDFGNDLGVNVVVVPKPTSKFNAIQSMRRLLYNTRFNLENTPRLIECLANYSKEFDIKKGVYKDQPLHNWASHGVDSFQTLTLALDANMIYDTPRDVIYRQ